MRPEHLEIKTREMMKAAHGEHEQKQLMLSEVKQVHVLSMMTQRFRDEVSMLEDTLVHSSHGAKMKEHYVDPTPKQYWCAAN